MQCLRREWAVPALQRGRLRLQGGGGGDGQPGKEGRQEHGHQVHRGAPHQVDLLQPMLLHAILHQMPGHRNPASRYTHHLVILLHTFSLLAVASCNSAALVHFLCHKNQTIGMEFITDTVSAALLHLPLLPLQKYNNVGHDILQAATQLALAQVI